MKSFKTVLVKFRRNFTIIPRKVKFIVKYTDFKLQPQQATTSTNLRSGRNLTARCSEIVDAPRDSVERSPKKVPPKMFPRTWSFTCTLE